MRMSKLRLAEYHYRKAANIHPRNAVLLGCVGMVSGTNGTSDLGSDIDRSLVRDAGARAFGQFADSPCTVQ